MLFPSQPKPAIFGGCHLWRAKTTAPRLDFTIERRLGAEVCPPSPNANGQLASVRRTNAQQAESDGRVFRLYGEPNGSNCRKLADPT